MDYNQLCNLFNEKNKLQFKLYSLEYNVELIDNKVVIYAIYYEKDKHYYDSFEDLMNNYNVYNEPLINQLNRIIIL